MSILHRTTAVAVTSAIFFAISPFAHAAIVTTGSVFPAGLGPGDTVVTEPITIGGNFSTAGTGGLEINGGSVLTSGGASPFINISPLAGSSGTATVSGLNSTWRHEGFTIDGSGNPEEGAFLTVGRTAPGTLTVSNGGKVIIDGLGADGLGSFGAAGLQVGRNAGSGGSVLNIEGPGSEVLVTNADHTFFRLGATEAATVNVSNYGSFTTGGDNSLMTLQNGTVNVSSGGKLMTQIFNVAPNDNNNTTVNLDGIDTLVHVTGGGTADNEYDLADFGGFMTIGGGASSSIGEVNLTNGAEIRIDSGTGIAADGTPIEGSGFSLGGNSAIGFGGQGTLKISSNSLVSVSGGGEFVGIGRTDGGGGKVIIDSGGQLIVESNPNSFGVFMATNPDSGEAILEIDGATSLFDAGSFLGVGVDGGLATTANALIEISNDATVRAQEIAVGDEGLIKGVGTLEGNVILNNGTISPGLSPGTLVIDGDFDFVDGVLEIEIAGTNAGEYDVLDISGAANLSGGTILFSFLDGFLPQEGDPVLEILVAGGGLNVGSNVVFDFEGVDESFEFDVLEGNLGLSFDALNDALPPNPVPVPAAIWLFLSAMGFLGLIRKHGSGKHIGRESLAT